MSERPTINGECLPADWRVLEWWGEPRMLRPGDKVVVTADRAIHVDQAVFYRDALSTRSRKPVGWPP